MAKLFKNNRKGMIQKNRVTRYLLYAIGEILLIVIGILLALYLQNKNESEKNNEVLRTTISMLKNEIYANKSKIENVQSYHIMLKDTLEKIDLSIVSADKKKFSFWRGMNAPRLQDAAFQTSVQTGIGREMDPEVLQILNGLYSYQQSYNDYITQSTRVFFDTDFNDPRSISTTMGKIKVIMLDLFYFEKQLISGYEGAIKKIDDAYEPE